MPAPFFRRLGTALYARPFLLLTLCAVFWAGNAIAGRVSIGHIGPFMLVFLRWMLVLVVLWPIYGGEVRAHWGNVKADLWRVILMGLFGFTVFNALFYYAAYHTSALNLGILQGSMPVFVLVGAFVAYGTRVTILQMLGVAIAILGVIVIATRGNPLAILDIELNKGDLAMVTTCAFYAYYTVALRNRPAMPGAAFFTVLALIASITSLPLVALEIAMNGFQVPTPQGWLVTAYVAIFPSCLAQIFFLRGVDLIGPGRAGIFVNLVPVFAAIMAVVLLHEPFMTFHGLALVLVLAGIALAQQSRPAPTPTARRETQSS